ncbi:hypothetical protein COCC4DRAFT_60630 [Bipolaris maydis ATCC 48331]|uniref:Uncharacterized protein n=2 Tax=Cochliobolus heterostrophus TaxID=5016 RepID=N4XGE9_COCH4|nr:uncharacterized protein COCC4DRAFT_60630 [Bipolaris maydis ATCC 48331]ENI05576.1 hypothetical protein COCC4DRAFT_60630 [Bipolaris maydis ATCC 48331]
MYPAKMALCPPPLPQASPLPSSPLVPSKLADMLRQSIAPQFLEVICGGPSNHEATKPSGVTAPRRYMRRDACFMSCTSGTTVSLAKHCKFYMALNDPVPVR